MLVPNNRTNDMLRLLTAILFTAAAAGVNPRPVDRLYPYSKSDCSGQPIGPALIIWTGTFAESSCMALGGRTSTSGGDVVALAPSARYFTVR